MVNVMPTVDQGLVKRNPTRGLALDTKVTYSDKIFTYEWDRGLAGESEEKYAINITGTGLDAQMEIINVITGKVYKKGTFDDEGVELLAYEGDAEDYLSPFTDMTGYACTTVKDTTFVLNKNISPSMNKLIRNTDTTPIPVTMEQAEKEVGISKETAGFVLPIGATINMDGTSLYQAVAAVFIMQVLWPEGLTFTNQLLIVATALLASIGSAAVPSAGMVMLVIVLETVGFPSDLLAIGLALIFAVDRPLDMCRTTVNVTGDATVSMIVAKSLGKLHDPQPKEWDDNYDDVKGN